MSLKTFFFGFSCEKCSSYGITCKQPGVLNSPLSSVGVGQTEVWFENIKNEAFLALRYSIPISKCEAVTGEKTIEEITEKMIEHRRLLNTTINLSENRPSQF